jgi:penicillin-binding protein 1A
MARNDNLRRGQQSAAPPTPPPSSRSKAIKLRLWLRRLLVWGVALTLLSTMIISVAVGLTVKSLPGFDELKNTQVDDRHAGA